MKFLNIVCKILLIIGGLNWGLMGIANFDVIAAIFGAGTMLTHGIYGLIGLSAVYKLYCACCSKGGSSSCCR